MSILAQYENAWIRAAEGDLSGIENLYDPDFSGFSHSSGLRYRGRSALRSTRRSRQISVSSFCESK